MAYLGNSTNLSDALDNHAYETRELKRGEIYYVDLKDVDYVSSHTQGKSRPGLIIQNDIGNIHGDTVIIALLTTKRKKDYPFQYTFILNGRESTIMFEQIMTVDQFRLQNKCGELTYKQMQEADKALMYSLQLNKMSIDNIVDFNILSIVTRKTVSHQETYFEIEIEYEYNQKQAIHISLDKLQKFDSKINKDMEFSEIKKKLNNIQGLHWLVANNQI